MNSDSLEHRIATLERAVKSLEERLAEPNHLQWRETVGMFRNDPIFKEIADAGRAIRDADRDER
jgi:hypothetical protein